MVIVRWDTGVRAADKRAHLLGDQFGSTKRYPRTPSRQHRPPDTAGARGGALPLRDAMTHDGSLAGSGCEPWGVLDDARASLGVPPSSSVYAERRRGECVAVVGVFGARVARRPRVRSTQTPWRN
jgi:hypothetical protein